MVKRISALFDIERGINGKAPEERVAVRRDLSKPPIEEMHAYMVEQRAKLSRGDDVT